MLARLRMRRNEQEAYGYHRVYSQDDQINTSIRRVLSLEFPRVCPLRLSFNFEVFICFLYFLY